MIPAYLGFVVSPAHQEKCWWPRDSGTAKSAIRDVPAQRRPIGARKRLKLPGAIMHPCEALETAKEMPLAEAVKIRTVVLSKGIWERLQVCPETLEVLAENGIEVEVLQTEMAVERFNNLREGVPVGGLFHSTC
jgi:hypothetical protein